MLANPKLNQLVTIHYGHRWLPNPLQGKRGRVVIVGKGELQKEGKR